MKLNLLTLITAAVQLSSAAVIQSPPPSSNHQVQPLAFFATFPSAPGTPQADAEYNAFMNEAKAHGLTIKQRRRFTRLVNAVSFEVQDEAAKDTLTRMKSVDTLFPMTTVAQPRVIQKDVANPQLKFAHGVTGVANVQKLGHTGKGVKVGIIDSGVDYKHPGLGGCFGKGCKVAYGHDFVGDDYAGGIFSFPEEDDDPMDCGGHGTHVAGIIAAKDKEFNGVAPDATLGAYRVFGCTGSTSSDVILAALERAHADGMQVINMSLGGGMSWPEHPNARAVDALVAKGVVVAVAAGNDGDKGMFNSAEPAVANGALAVGSVDNYRYLSKAIATEDEPTQWINYAPSDETKDITVESAQLVSGYNPDVKDDLACKPLPASVDVKGKFVLVQRGTCTFTEKARAIEKAGGAGMFVYNNRDGLLTPSTEGGNIKIPVAGITQAFGQKLVAKVNGKAVKLAFSKELLTFDNPSGGKVSDFSNWGPGAELQLKPNVAAPGGLIYSTYPLKKGGYATLSGTSMATPYIVGSVALYMEARGKQSDPAKYREVLQLTSVPTPALKMPSLLQPVQQQGAGLINVEAAVLNTVSVQPTQINVQSSDMARGHLAPLTLQNDGKYDITYTLRHEPCASVLPFDLETGEIAAVPALKDAPAKVDIASKQVTVRASSSEKVNVFVGEPSNLNKKELWMYSGFIVLEHKLSYQELLSGAKRQPTLRIPYSGMYGNYRQRDLFATSAASKYPVFIDINTELPIQDDGNATFTLQNFDVPVLMLRVIHPTKLLTVSLLDVASNKVIGTLPNAKYEFLAINDHDKNKQIEILWNGLVLPSAQDDAILPPPGTYRVRVSALRPFGKPENPKDYQVWDSPRFKVARAEGKESTEQAAPSLEKIEPAALPALRKEAAKRAALAKQQENSVLPLKSTWTARDTQ